MKKFDEFVSIKGDGTVGNTVVSVNGKMIDGVQKITVSLDVKDRIPKAVIEVMSGKIDLTLNKKNVKFKTLKGKKI